MNTGASCVTVQKYSDQTVEKGTWLSSDEAYDSDSDIDASDDSDSDDSERNINSDDPGLSKRSQEFRDALNSSSNSVLAGVTPTTREWIFTAEEKKLLVS